MFAWAREANNVESAYQASERAMLEVWYLLKGEVAGSGKSSESAGYVINELGELHFAIWDELFETKILPHADVKHALSSAIGSHAALDVNLKLFDLIGRLALRGLWMVWQLKPGSVPAVLNENLLTTLPSALTMVTNATVEQIDRLCGQLVQIVSNNRALLSPVADWQAIDISLAFTLLASRPGAHGAIDQWAEELSRRSIFAFHTHGRYPAASHSYWDLVDHPSERSDDYRQSATEGSILYPMLALWAAARGNQVLFDELAAFKEEALSHCTFQMWLPDEDSEEHLYSGRESHGAALTGLPVTAGTQDFVLHEMASNPHFDTLSAVRLGHWPIVLMACRCHRLPLPPQIWRDLLPGVRP